MLTVTGIANDQIKHITIFIGENHHAVDVAIDRSCPTGRIEVVSNLK